MPERIGLIEVFIDKPKFTTEELEKIAVKTASYFPKNLLEIILDEPLSLEQRDVSEYKVASALEDIRFKTGLSKIFGLSRGVHYMEKPENFPYYGREFHEKMVAVFDIGYLNDMSLYPHKTNVIPNPDISLYIAHELGHLYGLSHYCDNLYSRILSACEKADSFTKSFLTSILSNMKGLVEGVICKEIRNNEFEGLEVNIDCHGPYIMCAPFNVTEKSFSSKDYAFLESLVK